MRRKRRFSEYLSEKLDDAIGKFEQKVSDLDRNLYSWLVEGELVNKIKDNKLVNDTINSVNGFFNSLKEEKESLDETYKYEYLDRDYIRDRMSVKDRLILENEIEYAPCPMTDVEFLRYKKFVDDHKECQESGKDMISVVESHESGIGRGLTVQCTGCGKSADITDYASW